MYNPSARSTHRSETGSTRSECVANFVKNASRLTSIASLMLACLMVHKSKSNVHVYVRIRPFNPKEEAEGLESKPILQVCAIVERVRLANDQPRMHGECHGAGVNNGFLGPSVVPWSNRTNKFPRTGLDRWHPYMLSCPKHVPAGLTFFWGSSHGPKDPTTLLFVPWPCCKDELGVRYIIRFSSMTMWCGSPIRRRRRIVPPSLLLTIASIAPSKAKINSKRMFTPRLARRCLATLWRVTTRVSSPMAKQVVRRLPFPTPATEYHRCTLGARMSTRMARAVPLRVNGSPRVPPYIYFYRLPEEEPHSTKRAPMNTLMAPQLLPSASNVPAL